MAIYKIHLKGQASMIAGSLNEARALARRELDFFERVPHASIRRVPGGELIARVYRLDRTPPPDADDEPIEPDCDAAYNGL
jgi:hypothetical protein